MKCKNPFQYNEYSAECCLCLRENLQMPFLYVFYGQTLKRSSVDDSETANLTWLASFYATQTRRIRREKKILLHTNKCAEGWGLLRAHSRVLVEKSQTQKKQSFCPLWPSVLIGWGRGRLWSLLVYVWILQLTRTLEHCNFWILGYHNVLTLIKLVRNVC